MTASPIIWNGRRASAHVPALLAQRDLGLDAATATRTGEAVAELLRAAEVLDVDHEPLARLLLRSECVASSYVEGTTAPVVDVVLAEQGAPTPADSAAAWVAAALALDAPRTAAAPLRRARAARPRRSEPVARVSRPTREPC